jgi:hypothetical protein
MEGFFFRINKILIDSDYGLAGLSPFLAVVDAFLFGNDLEL